MVQPETEPAEPRPEGVLRYGTVSAMRVVGKVWARLRHKA